MGNNLKYAVQSLVIHIDVFTSEFVSNQILNTQFFLSTKYTNISSSYNKFS